MLDTGLVEVVEIVPVLVVEIVPVLVVEIVPVFVVEMVPDLAKVVAEIARTNVIVQKIDASFFIVLLLVIQMSGVTGRPEDFARRAHLFRPTIPNNRFGIVCFKHRAMFENLPALSLTC